jgi:hypothetical protein
VVQANHHKFSDFKYLNEGIKEVEEEDEMPLYEDSVDRERALRKSFKSVKSAESLDEIAECLDVDPVTHEESYQQMVFCPKDGELKLWRLV